MAFLRFTRDKRGYEHFYLVQPTTNRRGKARSRVLYWFRTPPNVRVGREPFDESVRRALETRFPDVQFDWRKIVETPIPSADAERWRERRRAERAEKAARRGGIDEEPRSVREESADVDEGAPDEETLDTTGSAGDTRDPSTQPGVDMSLSPFDDARGDPEPLGALEMERDDASETSDGLEPVLTTDAPTDGVASGAPGSSVNVMGARTHDRGRRRRRRRGRRGRHDVRAGGQQAPASQNETAPPSPVPDDNQSETGVKHVSDSGLTLSDEPEGE